MKSFNQYIDSVVCGDALEIVKKFPDESIDCVITSPPYWQMRNYGWKGQWGLETTYQAYLQKLWALMDEIKRVLKPRGTVWINLGDTYFGSGNDSGKRKGRRAQNIRKVKTGEIAPRKPNNHPANKLKKKCQVLIPHRFAIGCTERGWILRNDIIWAKPNGAPESVKDRFSKRHEFIFLFAKQPDYYFDLDSVREEYKETSLLRNKYPQITFGGDSKNKKVSFGKGKKNGGQLKTVNLNPNGKNPGDVSDFWSIPTRHGSAKHYATFNSDLILKPILAGCPKGGIVLDPFCGTGTTGEAALQLGRKFIGIDGKKEYCKISERRLSDHSLGDIDEKYVRLFTDVSLLDLPDSILIEWISVSEDQRRKGLATNALIKELQQLKNDGVNYIEAAQTSLGSYLFDSLERKGIIKEVDTNTLAISDEALENARITGLKIYEIITTDLEGVQILKSSLEKFVNKVSHDLENKVRHNKKSIEKLAAGFGITDKTEIKELTELAIVKRARRLAQEEGTIRERFDKIVDLYNSQVNLSHRTSQSILLQQYSTPAPIAYLAGVFCKIDQGKTVFEPSAGNGLLTIAALRSQCYVNEVDVLRRRNLESQGYELVMNQDATKPFRGFEKKFDAVLTNPPFGITETEVMYDTFPIKLLEHLMALRALDCMKDEGKAAIIIGGHTRWDEKGRIQAGKNRIFFNYLYSRYNVIDVINIDGHKLYSRQGTSFDVRLILIDGRKSTPYGASPVYDPAKDYVVKTFDELFERVIDATQKDNSMRSINDLEKEALALQNFFETEGLGDFYSDKINPTAYQNWLSTKNKFPDEKMLVLVKTGSGLYETYDGDAMILSSILSVRFRKSSQINGKLVHGITILDTGIKRQEKEIARAGYKLILYSGGILEGLGAPYEPASDACIVLNTQVPDSMAFETLSAVQKIKQEVGGDIDNFVRHRLKYPTKVALCKVLSAEQIDAIAMAIYNIEARGQGMIIGDQTGIGKGRVAAAMIRYGVLQGLKPVFLTEKANLFSDIYRDLSAIGSGHLKPFIVNSREPKTDIKDEDGNVIYQAPEPNEQKSIIESHEVPTKYDFVVATYSQFNSPDKKPEKPNFLNAIAEGNLFIMDEAHNSSGSSNTGYFMQGTVRNTRGVIFLSATFAKRPDNLPIYAMKTAIADCNMTKDELIEAIYRGGVALQEVLSSQLVAEGQMIRRERSFEGVEVNYITLGNKAEEHKAIADNITEILRDIIQFQGSHVDKAVDELDNIAVAEAKEVEIREGTSKAGVDNLPYFSKVFNVINQMLFSLKAEAVAERAIERLKEGKKPVIAFASTMGSFIETMENEHGLPVSDGDTINADFAEVLKRGLDGILRYTEKDIDGNPIFKKFEISEFPLDAQMEYHRILEKIKSVSTGISISPIDIIIKKIQEAGYSVAEVTGRKYELQLNLKTSKGLVLARKRINTNDAFRQFNNNEVDVLMINQSGSTGASAHAIPTAKVSKKEVKQRVMIVLQPELDISTEVQKRGRINRTGQILQPIYDYLTSAIPAEMRLMMMLQKKLKSLDANTASNQKQSSKILDVPDFLNKYGDKIVKEYLADNPHINELLDDPLSLKHSGEDSGGANNVIFEDAAMKVSGRVAVLSTKMQADFYTEISERYNDYVDYLKQIDEYDLEVEDMKLDAETVSSHVIRMGKGGDSAFGNDSILEKVRANVLKKPFTKNELENLINESLKGKDALKQQEEFLQEYINEAEKKLNEAQKETNEKYDDLIKDIPNEKRIKKLEGDTNAWSSAIKERETELEEAREAQLSNTEKTFNHRRQFMEKSLRFFFVGRMLSYPVESYTEGTIFEPAVFLGSVIDRKKKNPYTPSAIKLRFAIANSTKYVTIPASYSEDVMAIIGASADISQPGKADLLSNWEKYTKDNHVDRRIRHIITGNLLQAFGDLKGKLVSYTTIDKEVKKGILMPEHWDPKEKVQDNVVVPILKALPIIKSLVQDKHIVTNNGISIFRTKDHFKIIVSASRSKGGDIYLDKQILEIVEKNNFEKTSDKMIAVLPEKKIDELVELLQVNHGCSVTIQAHQLKDLKVGAIQYSNRKKIELPPPEEKQAESANVISMLELEAEALALELELLAA
ncbi:MAG TPA: DNA methyltransferase [Chitinophagaceae bacterium]|jgi:DNA modification methylase|nr:DNA methyltransferase [Chitinophagaceae bacterium]